MQTLKIHLTEITTYLYRKDGGIRSRHVWVVDGMCERQRSDVSTSQEMPRVAYNHLKLGQ